MNLTFIDLEFDTADRGAPLGDIAASLVSLHDLLRDLATLAAYPAGVEFREIQVVAIELRSPLKVRLSLTGIPAEALSAFQGICRGIILWRERRSPTAELEDLLGGALAAPDRVTEQERQRFRDHIQTLRHAAVPLKRVVVVSAE